MSCADTTDTPPEAIIPFWKRNRRVLTGLLVSSVVLGSLIALMLSYHPRWHTVTGVGYSGERVGSVECPEDWQLDTEDSQTLGYASMTVRRKPLMGVWAWLSQMLPHTANNTEAAIRIYVMPHTPLSLPGQPLSAHNSHADRVNTARAAINSLEQVYTMGRWGRGGARIFCKQVSHPLGPAIAISTENVSAAPSNYAASNVSRDEALYIVPTEAGDFTGMINVSYSGAPEGDAALKPILERITRSIRIVKK